MAKKRAEVRKDIVSRAKASWTMLLAYIYIIGGIIESQLDFVDKYIAEEWRAPAWITAMLLVALARMRSIVKDAKDAAKQEDTE